MKEIKAEKRQEYGGRYLGIVTISGTVFGYGDASDSKLSARRAGWRAAEEMGLVSR